MVDMVDLEFEGAASNEDMDVLIIDEESDSGDDDFQIDEYDLTATPNDFNVMTINSFIESGSIIIPGFQRNFVWDIKKASKLIESLLLGLPVPQLFLYESARNKFLVIDGQQRMMSIFYFIKKRFPKKEKRAEIRKIFTEYNGIPEEILESDEYFQPFRLVLSKSADAVKNKFHGLNYSTLGDYRAQFDLRPIRNIIVKQNSPKDGDSAIYEIFNRLNSGGVNLKPQEIRACLYHSKFFSMVSRLNYNLSWRRVLGMENLDIHMKDNELLLRCFAMADAYTEYKPSLAAFLNIFSKKAKQFDDDHVLWLESVFESFLEAVDDVKAELFVTKSGRFNIFIFESLFSVLFNRLGHGETKITAVVNGETVRHIFEDEEFAAACIAGTMKTTNVRKRFEVVERYLGV
ncbi:DUF262 domain-containing protein [Pseudomonas tolaasii]|uniref:DUF262 domain-containing protein n=1 Tax=Pseudomonas tolaasii TaxID=29442 RepID=UPI001C52FADF|nr:DUF262 domain-containing protein [Pseudomonas tolaasii]QXQ17915.1 DUF262 domain-containing protein [Pseudomonas tolaasii]